MSQFPEAAYHELIAGKAFARLEMWAEGATEPYVMHYIGPRHVPRAYWEKAKAFALGLAA